MEWRWSWELSWSLAKIFTILGFKKLRIAHPNDDVLHQFEFKVTYPKKKVSKVSEYVLQSGRVRSIWMKLS